MSKEKRIVKCPICGEKFDKNSEEYSMCGRRYCHKQCKEQKKDDNTDIGVYGIYSDGELIYVGMTTAGFTIRWKDHFKHTKNNDVKNMRLYKEINEAKAQGKTVVAAPIISFPFGSKSERDIKIMEYTLIKTLKPKCNTEGVSVDYRDFRKGW